MPQWAQDRCYAPPALTNQWSRLSQGGTFYLTSFATYLSDGTQGNCPTVNGVRKGQGYGRTSYLYVVPWADERQCTWLGLSANTRTALSVQADAVLSERSWKPWG